MTYPQPRTDVQVADGAAQWRLYTKVTQQGEIYEIDSSSSAIALGPDSDFANVNLTYLDESLTDVGLVGSIHVSPGYPFAGNLTPRLDTSYPLSSGPPPRLGRVLAWLLDNYNDIYQPAGKTANDTFFRVQPYLDLIGWQKYPPTLPSKRSDKTILFQDHVAANGLGAAGSVFYLVPCFGRKFLQTILLNKSGGNVTYEVRGVNFTTSGTVGAVGTNIETSLVASAPVANNASNVKVVDASALGMFDALVIGVGSATGVAITGAPLRIYMSDDPL